MSLRHAAPVLDAVAKIRSGMLALPRQLAVLALTAGAPALAASMSMFSTGFVSTSVFSLYGLRIPRLRETPRCHEVQRGHVQWLRVTPHHAVWTRSADMAAHPV